MDGVMYVSHEDGSETSRKATREEALLADALLRTSDELRVANKRIESFETLRNPAKGRLVRSAPEPCALLLVPCPRCDGSGKLKPYKLDGDTEWRIADCPERHVRAAQPPGSDAEDAAKWRALRNCARITAMGSAGCDPRGDSYPGPTAHVTLNFWTHNARESEPWHREWLDTFVSKALRATATKEAAPEDCPCDAPCREGYECMHPHIDPKYRCRRLGMGERDDV